MKIKVIDSDGSIEHVAQPISEIESTYHFIYTLLMAVGININMATSAGRPNPQSLKLDLDLTGIDVVELGEFLEIMNTTGDTIGAE